VGGWGRVLGLPGVLWVRVVIMVLLFWCAAEQAGHSKFNDGFTKGPLQHTKHARSAPGSLTSVV
jgi:hypothetical protein